MAARPRAAAGSERTATMVDRTRELAALRAGLRDAESGTARVVVIEGAAGVGKTALLQATRDEALAAGFRALWARSPHLATAAPYELLRRLLGPEVMRLGGPGALSGAAAFAAPLFSPGAATVAGVDYGCHWLLAALTDEGPLLLAVDDAHWADAESLRILADTAEDLQNAPFGIVVTARPASDPLVEAMLDRLATIEGARVLRPGPLTESGVAAVLRAAFGAAPDPAFTQACAQASGGNVFYLRELVRPLVAAGRPPTAGTAAELAATGPDALIRTVRWRLGELGPAATAVAQAAAVLGDDTPLRHVEALAAVDEAAVPAAALRAASILARAEPVGFPHPLVRAAVEQTIHEGQLGRLHARAARVLQQASAPAAQVAKHLLRAPPAASPGVVDLLAGEARHDLESGSPATAHQLLARALAEPPAPAERPALLLALAGAERATGAQAKAREHLAEVVETGSRELSICAMAELFELLYEVDDEDAAAGLRRRAIAAEPYGNTPAEIRLHSTLLMHVATGLAEPAPARLIDVDLEALPTGSGEQRRLLLYAAVHRRGTGHCPPAEFLAHLRRAVHDLPGRRPLTYWEVMAALESAAYLASVEAMPDADRVLARLRPEVARLRHIAPDLQAEWSHRTVLNRLRCGRFEEAQVMLGEAERFAERHGLTLYVRSAQSARGCIHLERGDYAEAARHLRRGAGEAFYLTALAELLSGRPAEALAGLALPSDPAAAVTEREIEFEAHLVASHAYERLGDRDRARHEAEREVAVRRRHGPPFRLALALRRRATFAPAREAVEMLAEASAAATGTPRLPVLARVQASYGAALRRAGRLREARTELAAALDCAVRLDMPGLATKLTAEIHAAGGRPRRTRVTGVSALTDSQAAVARLAAEGRTNREIAETLYVTIKTVETHLAAVYRKLAVPGREHLGAAMGAGR
ncbi:AAA family ATPase [Actinoplanes sp. Pm04-4]|uniref:AAA family ATPase n=1 Tax=Paractinoplanes pyxinae TaxID=2997416 RepID=A0ABT4AV97_9ACTN|nr:LuxR family transcriptional regulator [Actinoplanes pyxinae]MCY1138158.1 AAA family ATPase [Actinoplanes pyxinae]